MLVNMFGADRAYRFCLCLLGKWIAFECCKRSLNRLYRGSWVEQTISTSFVVDCTETLYTWSTSGVIVQDIFWLAWLGFWLAWIFTRIMCGGYLIIIFESCVWTSWFRENIFQLYVYLVTYEICLMIIYRYCQKQKHQWNKNIYVPEYRIHGVCYMKIFICTIMIFTGFFINDL